MARLCLVSPSHVANNPRLVKEADALSAAGHSVHVVCGRYYSVIDPYDRAIFRGARWRWTQVDYGVENKALLRKIVHKWAKRRMRSESLPSLRLAILANHCAADPLARAATEAEAEFYIGHTPAGLAAAATAATARGVRYGFDAEDFHTAETDSVVNDQAEARILRTIESAFLPGCSHLSAASPLIGEAYAKAYSLQTPLVLLNVFPRSEAPHNPPPLVTADDAAAPARLYWFSQTIGPGRGLEEMVDVCGRLKTPCELHLRGLPAVGFESLLRQRAKAAGFRGRIEFLPIADAAEMPRLCAGYALGLSLEQRTPLNRDLCLTNKIFTYILAGLPVGLTPTSAQIRMSVDLGAAAMAIDFSDPEGTAARLDAFLPDPQRRNEAQKRAWELGQTRYNWDVAQQLLCASVERALR